MADQDPVTRRLAGFTPATDGIDRDEWLFRAGRASVRPARGWVWACGALLTTQLATLGWYSLRPVEQVTVPVFVYAREPAEPPAEVDPPAHDAMPDSPPESPELWSYIALAREFYATGSLPAPRATPIDAHRDREDITAGSLPTWID